MKILSFVRYMLMGSFFAPFSSVADSKDHQALTKVLSVLPCLSRLSQAFNTNCTVNSHILKKLDFTPNDSSCCFCFDLQPICVALSPFNIARCLALPSVFRILLRLSLYSCDLRKTDQRSLFRRDHPLCHCYIDRTRMELRFPCPLDQDSFLLASDRILSHSPRKLLHIFRF